MVSSHTIVWTSLGLSVINLCSVARFVLRISLVCVLALHKVFFNLLIYTYDPTICFLRCQEQKFGFQSAKHRLLFTRRFVVVPFSRVQTFALCFYPITSNQYSLRTPTVHSHIASDRICWQAVVPGPSKSKYRHVVLAPLCYIMV